MIKTPMFKKKSRAFTIVELIVVIVVIGVLATIATVSYGNWKNEVNVASVKNDLMNAAAAFENYKNFNGSYPTDQSKISNLNIGNGVNIVGRGSIEGFCISAELNGQKFNIKSGEKTITQGDCSISISSNFSSFSTGVYSSCAISEFGGLYCWGGNWDGQLGNNSNLETAIPMSVFTSGVLSNKTATQVSMGFGTHVCSIYSDGNAYCWGMNGAGQLGNGNTNSSLVPVSVNNLGLLASKTIKKISVGSDHTCAIASDDNVYCWGDNFYGQLGNNSSTNSSIPVQVDKSGLFSNKTVKDISVGNGYSCAIASDDNAYCWGNGGNGRMGNNSTSLSRVPVAVSTSGVLSGKLIVKISAGDSHTCAIASDNNSYCWGKNSNGQLGDNSTMERLVPVAVNRSGILSGKLVNDISVGLDHTCLIANDMKAYCWGRNQYSQLGIGSYSDSSVPVSVIASGALQGKDLIKISSADYHNCAMSKTNELYCWGYSHYGQLGSGVEKIYSRSTIAVRPKINNISAVSSGNGGTCSISIDNTAYCWGSNTSGQLGNNSLADSFYPVPVYTAGLLSGKQIKQISTSSSHSCVIASDDNAYCWGSNSNGALGNNSTSNSSVPVAVNTAGVLSGKYIKNISVGFGFTCAIASDNYAYCWGQGDLGQLGNNTVVRSLVPTSVITSGVLSGKTLKKITTGSNHTCVIASDDLSYCWGNGSNGKLGNGLTSNSSVPVSVSMSGLLSGKTIKQISLGDTHTCVVASDNLAYCWGNNSNGRLGDGTNTSSLVSLAVSTSGVLSGKSIKDIDLGNSHTCAIASDDKVYCWGDNSSGQLGNNSTTTSYIPVLVNDSGLLSGKVITKISSGNNFSCALDSINGSYCWGSNSTGQLGSQDRLILAYPVKVPLLTSTEVF